MIRWFSVLFLIPLSISASERPLKAIALKEGNACSLACLAIYDLLSDELGSCVNQCREDARIRGAFPVEFPKYSKRQQALRDLSNKM